jgi:phenylpropionate dioxygenase-like ring-hydroxylating dioxygenase large terminal subunit
MGAEPTRPRGQSAVAPSDDTWLDNIHPALRRCWHPVALSSEVTEVPTRVWLVGEPLVVVRLAGTLAVFADRCPHRLAPLSAGVVVDGELECAYHGWRFESGGGCTSIPSAGVGARIPPKARAEQPWGVIERDGLVFVALEEPIVALPEIDLGPDGPDEEVRTVVMGPYEGRYGAGQLIDNQIDVSHFAFLHRRTFGSDDGARPDAYEVERRPWGFSVDMDIPIRAANDPAVALGLRPLDQYRHMSYRYQAPFHLVLRLGYPMMGGTNTITFWVQPQSAQSARMYVSLRLWQPGGFTDAELAERLAFEERVVAEDLIFQASFDHQALPLDVTEECHVRSDRASLEYRRQLRALVAESGSSASIAVLPPPAGRSSEASEVAGLR